MKNQIDDLTFRKLIDQTSPSAQATKKLCLRLGYDTNDLVYRSLDEFPAANPEIQRIKYEHYKNRVLKIVNDILATKTRHKLDQSIKQITLTQIQDKEYEKYIFFRSNSQSADSSLISINIKKRQKWQSRQKILKNLIYEQLQEEKKHAEYLRKQQKKENELQTHNLKKSSSNFKVKHKNNQICDNAESEESKRHQYFITATETESRIQEQRSSRFRIKDQKGTYSERAFSKRKQREVEEDKEISERLQNIQMKENQAKIKVEMFRTDLKSYFAQKHSQIISRQEKRNKIIESQQQTFINEQCEKLKRFTEKKNQITSEERKIIEEKKIKHQKMQVKCIKNVDLLNYKYQEGYNATYQQLVDKQSKVINNKQTLLEQKSLMLKDKFSLKLEDIEFNRAHALRLKQNSETKFQKDTKSQQSNRTVDTLRVKNQLMQKESEEEMWQKAKQVVQLFADPIEYEQYIEQQQLVLMKKRKSLDPKFAASVSLVKELWSQKEAEKLLMPPQLKDLKLQQSRVNTKK